MASRVSSLGVASSNDGTCFYTEYNIVHQDIYKGVLPAALKVIDEVMFDGGTFVICDYGSADGGFSMDMFGQCIGLLKTKYGKNQQIQIVYEDLPSNDFVTLFKRLGDGPSSYLSQYPAVFVSTVGRSFYEQCLPDNSVHFGFSSTAFNWLSGKPCNLKRGLIYHYEDADEEEIRIFREYAMADFTTILLHRAKELAPGGRLLLNCCGTAPNGESCSRRDFLKTMNALWRGMYKDGIITQDELKSTTVLNYLSLTEEDFLALFNKESAVYQSGLRLVSVDWKLTEDPRQAIWAANRDKGLSARDFAEGHANGIRSWTYNSILESIPEGRSQIEKQGIVDELFQRFVDIVAEAPEKNQSEAVHARLHVQKIMGSGQK